MDEYIAWLWEVEYWHWWALGLGLVALEVVVPSTFLLWPGLSAGLVGVLLIFFPDLDWRIQILLFAVLAVAATVAGRAWLRRHAVEGDRPGLNARADAYLGRRFRATEAIDGGAGRLQVDDGWWRVTVAEGAEVPAGAMVEVVGHDGATLTVRPVGA